MITAVFANDKKQHNLSIFGCFQLINHTLCTKTKIIIVGTTSETLLGPSLTLSRQKAVICTFFVANYQFLGGSILACFHWKISGHLDIAVLGKNVVCRIEIRKVI